ncbi:C-X-C chemokine receptor type 3-2 [Bombina bombina]|uniref:C-X-C chemokine receptor type 3-2 n=1 Tax=Bombina bombina TaxID=8345 RepID=UPI00235AA877|nr:C-X-C chemokine receptor type 3-2 [Bombina bombina]
MEDINISEDEEGSMYDYDYSPTGLPDSLNNVSPCTTEAAAKFNKIFIPIAFSLVFLLGLIGNGLVLHVLMSRRCSWHLADYYLFQLAVSDLLLGFTLPFWASQFNHGWIFGRIPCKILGALFTMNMYSGIFFLACISINRYLSIVHAIEFHKKQRPIHTLIISISVWGLSGILSWQEFYFRDVQYISQFEKYACLYNFDAQKADTWRVKLCLINLIMGFLIPLILMFYLYSKIFYTLLHSRLNYSYRSQVVIVVVLLAFVLCWAPYNILKLIDSFQRLGIIKRACEMEKMLDIGSTIAESLGLAHVCFNPIIYAFVGVKFREKLSEILKRGTRESTQNRLSSVFSESNHSYSRII